MAIREELHRLMVAMKRDMDAHDSDPARYMILRSDFDPIWAELYDLATAKPRIECASCRKAPTDDPGVALLRKNVKGVPGVFLCQWCDPERDDHTKL